MLKHIHERTNYIDSTISNGKLRKLNAVLSEESVWRFLNALNVTLLSTFLILFWIWLHFNFKFILSKKPKQLSLWFPKYITSAAPRATKNLSAICQNISKSMAETPEQSGKSVQS